MSNVNITYSDLRRDQYEHHDVVKFPELHHPFSSPYTWVKSRFYMEASAVLVYFLLKTNIHPNIVTLMYGLSGLMAGALIATANGFFVVIGVVIFFLRGILDWSDGHLARRTGRTSMTGHILDVYGAILGSIGLGIGLGLFVAKTTGYEIIYYLVPLYPVFRALLLTNYSQSILLRKMIVTDYTNNNFNDGSNTEGDEGMHRDSSFITFGYKLIYGFMDDRARTVDFIGLSLLIDVCFDTNYTLYIFLLLLLKWFIAYIGTMYLVTRGGWVETDHNSVIKSVLSSNNHSN